MPLVRRQLKQPVFLLSLTLVWGTRLCTLEAAESELEIEVEELRRLVAVGRDPMIEEVVLEGNQGVVGNHGRSRSGGRKTKNTERKLGGMAARCLLIKVASGMSRRELSMLSKRLSGLSDLDREK